MNLPDDKALSANEGIKVRSNYLRGTILDGLADPVTGAISADDGQLTKFHGTYQQDDRDLRQERLSQKLEPLYSFMIRVRVPGGICSPAQWLEMDRLAQSHANSTLRLTTRQAFQFHGVYKSNLRDCIKQINDTGMDTIAACGDVNRNVMCNVNPEQSHLHQEVYSWACKISEHLTPQTGAYDEIWLGAEPKEPVEAEEPIYGKTYLPRKFKMAVAIPPSNDVDLYSNDLGLIAIEEAGELAGFNVVVGGGFGRTHAEPETYPRLGNLIGFCTPQQVVEVAEKVVCVQRDYGDRSNRKHARLKYTIDDRGIDWFTAELENYLGWKLQPAREFSFNNTSDHYGWQQGVDGNWFYTLFIENGRVADREHYPLMTGLRQIAQIHQGDFRLTPNQNLCIGQVKPEAKAAINHLLEKYQILNVEKLSATRKASMACVAFPTCALAMAESERYLPTLIDKLDGVMADAGLADDPIMIRMTGCPNGCGRPYLGEIGLVGKSPGHYQLWLGASVNGDRLSRLEHESVNEEQILNILTPLIQQYAEERKSGEPFGDFVVRSRSLYQFEI
ncbi:MAG: NADPH-dependent assimilatory sulfite reductase hemoprotein subunit [Gammaproteobacteria bacterium]